MSRVFYLNETQRSLKSPAVITLCLFILSQTLAVSVLHVKVSHAFSRLASILLVVVIVMQVANLLLEPRIYPSGQISGSYTNAETLPSCG